MPIAYASPPDASFKSAEAGKKMISLTIKFLES
jgi:hypothetical protein